MNRNDDQQEESGAAIRTFRKLKKLTQAELAERIGLAPNSLAILERGERDLTVKNLNALAKALDIPASFLMIMGTEAPRKRPAVAKLVDALQGVVVGLMKFRSKVPTKKKRRVAKAAGR